MRSKLFLLLIFAPILFAQTPHNFFPTRIGDKYQIKNISRGFNYYPPIVNYPDKYFKYIITDSTVMDRKTFYNINNNYYHYNLSEQKLYTIKNNSVVLAIDFNLTGNQENLVSFNGVNQPCHHSGIYTANIFGESRNLFTVYYDTTISFLGVTHIIEKFTFCEGIGWIYHYYYYYRDSDPADTQFLEFQDSTISVNVNNNIYFPIKPIFTIDDTIKDRRLDEFPLSIKSFFDSPYPALNDSIYAHASVIRNSSIIYDSLFNFHKLTGLTNISFLHLKPDDSLKVFFLFTDNSIYMNRIRLPETGKYGFKVLSPLNSIKSLDQMPADFSFSGYPNPFNPELKLKYYLPTESSIKIEIFNSLGKSIKILESRVKQGGIYEINWHPEFIPSGIYFAKMNCASVNNSVNFNKTIKLIYLK